MKKFAIDPMLRRWPRALRGFFAAKLLMRRHVFRSREVWVQVQSGFAEGMWMRLRIPGEGAYWLGEHEPELQSALKKMVRPGDVVYDIGRSFEIDNTRDGSASRDSRPGYSVRRRSRERVAFAGE
jgi:hypothetical protein